MFQNTHAITFFKEKMIIYEWIYKTNLLIHSILCKITQNGKVDLSFEFDEKNDFVDI